ncbi:MAG: hypothetical protein KAJ19_16930, partial [Gammaproteobacteria bacterium]|nr:hypothetical protein [Gammaproteobacteria bacterium]
VIGNLQNIIDLPDGSENYTASDTILLQGYAENYCGEPIVLNTSTEVRFNLSNNAQSYDTNCTVIDRVGANVYKCNWNPEQETPYGYYNVSMWSNYTNYYENLTIKEYPGTFYLTTSPSLTLANVTPRQDSWSIQHNFSIRVADNLGDAVNVTLQEQVLGQSWYDVYSVNCTNCSDNAEGYALIEFNNSYVCSGYAGEWMKFRFKSEDGEGNTVYTDSMSQYYQSDDTFELQKSDVNVTYIYGNETTAWPTQSTEFGMQVYDLDNGSYVFSGSQIPLVKYDVTTNGALSALVMINSSYANASGHSNVTFLPDTQFYNGNQTWYGYVGTDDTCYKYSKSENLTVEVVINWPPLYFNESIEGYAGDESTSLSKGWGDGWTFNVSVMDQESDNVTVDLQLNTGSGWFIAANQTCTECTSWETKNFSISLDCGNVSTVVQYRFNITDDENNQNITSPHSFTIEEDDITYTLIWGGQGNISNRSADLVNLSLHVQVTDENGSLATPNTTLYITKVGTGGGASWDSGHSITANDSGEVQYDFFPTCDNVSTPTESEEYEVGLHQWYVEVDSSDSCYKPQQTDTYNFTVYGSLYPIIDLPDGSQNFSIGETVLIQGFIQNYCEEPMNVNTTTEITYTLNTTGYGDNCSSIDRIGANVYKCNWVPWQDAEYGYYNVSMWT